MKDVLILLAILVGCLVVLSATSYSAGYDVGLEEGREKFSQATEVAELTLKYDAMRAIADTLLRERYANDDPPSFMNVCFRQPRGISVDIDHDCASDEHSLTFAISTDPYMGGRLQFDQPKGSALMLERTLK